METTYEVLARVLRDDEGEATRQATSGDYEAGRGATYLDGYVDGLHAAMARLQAAMWLAKQTRPGDRGHGPNGGGGGDDGPDRPPIHPTGGGGRLIEADYSIAPINGRRVEVRTLPKDTTE